MTIGNFIKIGAISLFLILASFTNAWTQTAPSVRGKIVDNQTNGYLEGAVIALQGTLVSTPSPPT